MKILMDKFEIMNYIFGANKVALIDTIGNVNIFRGARPLVRNSEFAYSELADRLLDFKVDLRSSLLLDICLIDCTGEREEFVPEVEAFGINSNQWPSSYWPPYLQSGWAPKTLYGSGNVLNDSSSSSSFYRGKFIWWPIQGMTAGDDANTFLRFPGWDFSGLVDYVRELGESNKDNDVVIYFHCSSGADRTGALHMGYLIGHCGKSYADSLNIASEPVGAPNADYICLIKEYCKNCRAK